MNKLPHFSDAFFNEANQNSQGSRSGNLLVLICLCVSVLMVKAVKGLFLCTCFLLGLSSMIQINGNAGLKRTARDDLVYPVTVE